MVEKTSLYDAVDAVNTLGNNKTIFLNEVQNEVQKQISGTQLSICLTLLEQFPYEVKERKPTPPDMDYLECLIAFCRENKCNSHEIDSALTPIVIHIITEKYEKYYQDHSEELSQNLLKVMLPDKAIMEGVLHTLLESKTFSMLTDSMKKKLSDCLINQLHNIMSSNLTSTITHSMTHIVTQAVSQPIAHTTALLLMKIMDAHLKILIAKVLASVTFKTMIAAAIKKYVAGAVIAIIIKFLRIKFAYFLGALSILRINTLSTTDYTDYIECQSLGEEISIVVRKQVDNEFDNINNNIISNIFCNMCENVGVEFGQAFLDDQDFVNQLHKLASI